MIMGKDSNDKKISIQTQNLYELSVLLELGVTTMIATPKIIRAVADLVGTPAYLYNQKVIEEDVYDARAFERVFGEERFTLRYAMKANSLEALLRLFNNLGLHIDSSDGNEVWRAERADIELSHVLLTCQILPPQEELADYITRGMNPNAGHLDHLEQIAAAGGKDITVRINFGEGSGGTPKTTTGGYGSSFGMWHTEIPEILERSRALGLRVVRLHSHIGSGSDPQVWKRNVRIMLEHADAFPDVHTLNLGGGFKRSRWHDEKTMDMEECARDAYEVFEAYQERSGRRLRIEIEPGTYLIARGGILIGRFHHFRHKHDPDNGIDYNHTITDIGMTENARVCMYGARHHLTLVPEDDGREMTSTFVVGPACESGDALTVRKNDPNRLRRERMRTPTRGDLIVQHDTGAYCDSMAPHDYNSHGEAPAVLLKPDGELVVITYRGTREQLVQHEVKYSPTPSLAL